MNMLKDEFDKVYFIDSNWEISKEDTDKMEFGYEIVRENSSVRYYDAFKNVLPKIKEDLVLFTDNDMVFYRKGIIYNIFSRLADYDVVSIYDTIGKTHEELGGKSKFCPYLFATKKDLLMKYLDVDWGSNMPEHETLGKLTEEMLGDGVKPYELEEDKSDCLFNKTQDGKKSNDLGYYHIRAGSVPAVLLAYRDHDHKGYEDYIGDQPKQEYLRQIAWYYEMTNANEKTYLVRMKIWEMLKDIEVDETKWKPYIKRFREYHGL